MFKIPESGSQVETDTVEIFVDDKPMRVPNGISVAAAMLLVDALPFRYSKVDQSPRAPYCLMGVCAECLVTINDESGQFACQTMVIQGMRVERNLCSGNLRSGADQLQRTDAD